MLANSAWVKVKWAYVLIIILILIHGGVIMKRFIVLAVLLLTAPTYAQLSALKSDEDFIYSNYYKVRVDPRAEIVDLLHFETIEETFPLPAEPYKRDVHFGGWLRDNTADSCLNTRAKVLVRDSVTPVTFSANHCTVTKGTWDDPYTARPHLNAHDIQIDHLVALKNAYMTGAFEWNFAKRCLYANYMGNKFHLLSVDGPENLKKSDHSPSAYVPPNKNYTCQFVKNWLNIKTIWSLRITPKEGDAIQNIVEANNCNPADFVISMQSLNEQQRFMTDHADLCATVGLKLENF